MPFPIRLLLAATIFIMAGLISSCSGISSYYDENRKDPRTRAEAGFKPLSFKGDTEVIPPPAGTSRRNADSILDQYQLVGNPSDSAESSPKFIYRVQIFTSRFLQEAQQSRNELYGKFDQTIYMDFEEPYYKVRIGDFETSKAGESFLNEVLEMGYTDAWLVKIKKQ